MAYIRDIVTHDRQAEFRNDVQLSHYDDPKTNLGLMQSFIFSHNAPRGMSSAVDLLERLRSTFTIARQENRLVCIANYGHGKSHLALVIANYFAKPYGSPELEKVLEKVSKAVDNQTKVDHLRDFRKEQGEFLVIRLRGDVNIGLREQFITQIQIAFKEHEATKNTPLSFWSDKALRLLESLNGEQAAKAEDFLNGLETDLPALMDDVRNHRDQGYDRTRSLFQHLNGYLPDFGGEVSLNVLVKDVVRDYCGEGKPLAGMVVLFDEFSLFIQRYAKRRGTGELMELLVGIEELSNKAVFLAFSQHDPITVAKNYVDTDDQAKSLEHELSRIPNNGKLILYSLMESVIDAYLHQPDKAWEEFASNQQAKGPLARASNAAMDLFHKRYEEELRWNPEKFDRVVTRGAFPLHPMTTSLLCNLSFGGAETIGNPRTLLGFIREQVTLRQDQPVIVDGQINWILPIFLVDYFEEYLGKEPFRQYAIAEKKLPEDAPAEQRRLLKALLLQEVAGLRLNRDNQENFLEEAAGIPHGATKKHLSDLVSSQCIRLDEARRTYAFWSLSADPDALKKKIQQLVAGKEFTWEMLEALTKRQQVQAVPVAVKWGNSEDWEAREVLLTRKFYTPERLRALFPSFHTSDFGTLEEGVRGGVIWLIPEAPEDITWFEQHTEEILDQAFPGESPLPIIAKSTSRIYPKLLRSFQELRALEGMSEADRREAGLESYEHEKQQLEMAIRLDMVNLRGEASNYTTIPHKKKNYIIPAAYRSRVSLSNTPSVKQVLEECYRLAYPFSPPEFFTQYRNPARGSNNLWKGTRLLSAQLIRNSIQSNYASLRTDRIAQDILQLFLYSKWKIVRTDNAIQEPENGNISRAWSLLDETFRPGVRNLYVRDLLIKLLNPPYGYDYNTLTILLSAWVGYHQHDLQYASMGSPIKFDDFSSYLTEASGRQPFIGDICGSKRVSISRRDSEELIREAKDLIERVNKDTFTQTEAGQAIGKLKVHSQDEGLPEDIRTAARSASERLASGMESAVNYDREAGAIWQELENGKDIQAYIQLKKRIGELPRTVQVLPMQKPLAELDEAWREGLQKRIENECRHLVNVARLQDVGRNLPILESLKKQLKTAKLDAQASRVQDAIGEIISREKQLEAQEKELPVQTEIRSMDKRMPLQTLYSYQKRLQEITGYSSATMAECQRRLEEVQSEVQQLVQLAQMLITSVENINSLEEATKWQTTFLSNYARFEESSLQPELDTANAKVEKLRDFLRDLEGLERLPMRNLDEVVQKVRQIETLQQQNQSWLNHAASEKITQAAQRVKLEGKKRSDEAHQWLAQVETLYAKQEPLYRIIRELSSEPPYLRPDDRVQLEQLKLKVQHKQEEDVVARIETEFRKITDLSVKQECLKRLQAILSESKERSSVN